MKNLFLSILLCITVFLPSLAQVNTGLVAYYPFTGNANDASGNNINTSINKAVPATDRFGNPNNAYWFGGDSNTYIEVSYNSLLNIPNSKSISVWYKLDTFPTNYYPTMIHKDGNVFSSPTFGVELNNDPSYSVRHRYKTSMYFGNGNTSHNKTISTQETYLDNAILKKWIHIVATYSITSGYQKIYYNGVLSDSIHIGNFSSDTASTPMEIGRGTGSNNHAGNYFQGYIDDIRLYNRELNSNEVDSLFNAVNPTLSVTPVSILETVQIFPNPASNEVYISNISEQTDLKIFDATGKLCAQRNLEPNTNILDISSLPTGIYIVLLNSKGYTKTYKLSVK